MHKSDSVGNIGIHILSKHFTQIGIQNTAVQVSSGYIGKKSNKQIRRIVVPRPATNLTLKWVKGQGHRMVPIERACHKDYACQISTLYR